MVFSTIIFLFRFLPITLALYYLAPAKLKNTVLFVCSLVFYCWGEVRFFPVMLALILINYLCGLGLEAFDAKPGVRKVLLLVALAASLGMLFYFKYANFVLRSINSLLGTGFAAIQGISVLPLGISFYTFQTMSYTIDVYRGHAAAIRNFIDFACYISMFPQLVAGPIIRFSEVAGQLRHRTHTLEKFSRGVAFLALGLAKKVLLANPCGKIADTVFGATGIAASDAWYGVSAYAFQIYFDFSGYSDMAIGLGLMLGFVFAKNFDSPYRSQSITEFWRRWHVSLSSWLRDYLYIPLGGNRGGPRRTAINLALVMLLGGLWHGAAWTFVLWGAFHGGLLMAERLGGKRAPYHFLPPPLRVACTFVLVLFAWVLFRAPDLPAAVAYFQSMFGLGAVSDGGLLARGLIYRPYYVAMFGISAVAVWALPQTWDWTRVLTPGKTILILIVFVLAVVALSTQAFNPFIYFIF